jgi:hypothetical protein
VLPSLSACDVGLINTFNLLRCSGVARTKLDGEGPLVKWPPPPTTFPEIKCCFPHYENKDALVRNRRARIEGRTSPCKLTSYRPVWIERCMDVEVVAGRVAEDRSGPV